MQPGPVAHERDSFIVQFAVPLFLCRLRFLPVPVFVGLSAALFGWLLYIMVADSKAKGLQHPLASYPDVYGFGRPAAA